MVQNLVYIRGADNTHAQRFNNEATPVPDQSMLQAALIVGRTYTGKFEVRQPEMST